jgi:uncharacterized protein
MDQVTSEAELRELLGEPVPAALAKERRRLHDLDREWLAASPFCLVATSAADGSCDVSPKGDPPGFTVVLDDRTIALPERPGNRRADGLRNVLGNPHVGLVYLALVVEIEQVFHHCSKAFLRSRLWDQSSWDPHAVPARPRIAQALERPEASLEELTGYYGPSYAEGLYRTP